jgi:probable HAF family extracellular repeat protein
MRSGAFAVSRDGRVVAGFGTDETGQHAVVWVERVPTRLDDLLLDADGTLPDGIRLLEVRAVSADGRIFAGNAINSHGAPEAFRIVLPSAL